MRNPNALTFEPQTKTLWCVVNEGDKLGPDLMPDYMTSVKDGGFDGWPYSYWCGHVDPRVMPQRPELAARATVPDYSLSAHVAPVGMTICTGTALPQAYRGGAFVGEHGSWDRELRSRSVATAIRASTATSSPFSRTSGPAIPPGPRRASTAAWSPACEEAGPRGEETARAFFDEETMALTSAIKGVVPIAPTPFHPDGRIDEDSLERMCAFFLAAGIDGLTILGQLGEAPKLDHAEAVDIARRVIGRMNVPVLVGVSAPGFAAMRALAREVMELGAAGVMIGPPNTLRTDDQIAAYYRNAAEAIGPDVPFVIQDYPLTFSVVMTPAVIRRLVNENPSCVMLKHEDWPGLDKITALRGFERDGSMRHIAILTGNGGLFLDFEMERGADGANTGYAFPEMLVDVVRMSAAGERDAAHDLFDAHLPYLRYEQQQGPLGLAVRKYVFQRRGIFASDTQRQPAASLLAQARGEVDYLVSRIARVDPRARVAP